MSNIIATQTFAIGEECKNGVISAEIHDDFTVRLINREWDFVKGHLKTSDQSQSHEVGSIILPVDALRTTGDFWLNELTTSYHTSRILDWCQKAISKISTP